MLNQMVLDSPANLDRVFHALAHPARRDMLRRLAEEGERSVGELAAPLAMSLPAASKHVRVLEQARLIKRRVVGRTHICWIEGEPLARVSEWLEGFRKHWEGSFQRLDALLEEMKSIEGEGEKEKRG